MYVCVCVCVCDLSVLNIAINNWTRVEWESKTVEEIINLSPGDGAEQRQNSNNESNNNDDLHKTQLWKKWQRWKKPVFHKMVCVCDLLITLVINCVYMYIHICSHGTTNSGGPNDSLLPRLHNHILTHTHTYSVGKSLDGWSARRREIYLWKHNTQQERERPSFYRRDSNLQSQRASGRRTTP